MPVYFPGTIAEQAALVFDLRAGADAGGADIPLAPIRARHVRGVVINGATGQLAQYAGLEVDGTNVGRADPLRGSLRTPSRSIRRVRST